jgi:dolichol-phosphate mannosyltransferase
MKKPILSIVLPTYNELENIYILIPKIEEKFSNVEHEIIVVDDDSPDGTGLAVEELNKKYENIRLITRRGGKGIGAALKEGYDCALGEIIMSSDADLSFTVEDMHRLYEKIKEGYDLVVGVRHGLLYSYYEMKKPIVIVKGTISRIGNAFLRILSGIDIHDFSANFRAVRKEAWDRIELKENTNVILFEMIIKAKHKGMKIAELPVSFKDRIYGKSKLRLTREISKAAFKTLGYIYKYR